MYIIETEKGIQKFLTGMSCAESEEDKHILRDGLKKVSDQLKIHKSEIKKLENVLKTKSKTTKRTKCKNPRIKVEIEDRT